MALLPYPATDRYLIGVSGGRDSVALLHGLHAAGYQRLVVCHLNHGLRGADAQDDAAFVRKLADEKGLPVEVSKVDVRALASQRKLSVETAAREARYQFFTKVAGRRRCRTLFLAHQADDQAETFLFNLLRGAGPAGLAAMTLESRRQVGRQALTLVRPLLSVWRREIEEYLHARGLAWRDDATNADPAHGTRNRLRNKVLPMLDAAMSREVKPALWRAADILGAEEAWLGALCSKGEPVPEKLPIKTLRTQALAERRRTVRGWLLARRVSGVGYREVEAVLTLLAETDAPAKVNLPGDRHARRRGGVLFIE